MHLLALAGPRGYQRWYELLLHVQYGTQTACVVRTRQFGSVTVGIFTFNLLPFQNTASLKAL